MVVWLRLALRADIVRRSRKVALMVGTILVVINYGDRLLSGDIRFGDGIKMVLTYCVPYCVSTYAAVSAVLAAERGAGTT
jgi:hypothetical protein